MFAVVNGSVVDGGNTTFMMRSVAGGRCESLPAKSLSKVLACESNKPHVSNPPLTQRKRNKRREEAILTREEILALRAGNNGILGGDLSCLLSHPLPNNVMPSLRPRAWMTCTASTPLST